MAENLLDPVTGLNESKLESATAIASDVLSGKTFYAGDKDIKTGTMTNRGAWNGSVAPGSSVSIPAGYHNGSGKVTAGSAKSGNVLGIYAGHAPGGENSQYNINNSYNSEYMSSGNKFSKSFTAHVHIQFGHGVYLNSIIIQVAGQTLYDGEALGSRTIDKDISVSPGSTIYIARHGGSAQTSSYFLVVTTLA